MTVYALRERPTADQSPRDMSLEAARASAAAEGRRCWAACVCGGIVIVEEQGNAGILAAVREHNASLLHVEWRTGQEIGW
jgi:hypothetical protein